MSELRHLFIQVEYQVIVCEAAPALFVLQLSLLVLILSRVAPHKSNRVLVSEGLAMLEILAVSLDWPIFLAVKVDSENGHYF